MIYNFERLLKKYGVKHAELVESTAGGWVNGYYEEPTTKLVPLECVIVPMATRVIYNSGGRYSSGDRNMYARVLFPLRSKVIYKAVVYSVEEVADYTEYGNFYTYVLKRLDDDPSEYDRLREANYSE